LERGGKIDNPVKGKVAFGKGRFSSNRQNSGEKKSCLREERSACQKVIRFAGVGWWGVGVVGGGVFCCFLVGGGLFFCFFFWFLLFCVFCGKSHRPEGTIYGKGGGRWTSRVDEGGQKTRSEESLTESQGRGRGKVGLTTKNSPRWRVCAAPKVGRGEVRRKRMGEGRVGVVEQSGPAGQKERRSGGLGGSRGLKSKTCQGKKNPIKTVITRDQGRLKGPY